MEQRKFFSNDRATVPILSLPICRAHYAAQRNAHKNLLFATWGGIGDVICSEPTIRYAIEKFKDCKITVATHTPEIFANLPLHDIYDLRKENPIEDDHLILHTIPRQDDSSLIPQFISHMVTNCVDFASLSALRMQLPIKDRNVILRPSTPKNESVLEIVEEKYKYVPIHAGRHWPSKTFPTEWWNNVITSIKQAGLIPVLIGKHDGESQGYVDTDADGCIDLRDKTSLNDSIWMLQRMPVVVCNDSSPLHMAVTGEAWILFVPSVKHPDYIMHYRKNLEGVNSWGWRMLDLSRDGFWNYIDTCPNKTEDLLVDKSDPSIMERILPDTEIFGKLCQEKIDDYARGT